MKVITVLFSLVWLVTTGHAASDPSQLKDNRQIIENFVAAYNAQDIDGMRPYIHPDIEWISIEGSSSSVVSKGADALEKELEAYFSAPNAPTSSLKDWSVNVNFLAVTETARWTGKDGEPREQSSLAVYQMKQGMIRRVWYYPAQ